MVMMLPSVVQRWCCCCRRLVDVEVRQTCGWECCVRIVVLAVAGVVVVGVVVVIVDVAVVIVVVGVAVAMTPLRCHRDCRDFRNIWPGRRSAVVDRHLVDWPAACDLVEVRMCCHWTTAADVLVHRVLVRTLDM